MICEICQKKDGTTYKYKNDLNFCHMTKCVECGRNVCVMAGCTIKSCASYDFQKKAYICSDCKINTN